MAKQNDSLNNAHPPVSLSADPPWIGFPNTNWGASLGPTFSVTLDPQVVTPVLAGLPRAGQWRHSLREMNQLLEEFAEGNDDLLDELAG